MGTLQASLNAPLQGSISTSQYKRQKVGVESFKKMPLWYVKPGEEVQCDYCSRWVAQTLGSLQGAHGHSKQIQGHLDQKLAEQMDRIEALLAKRQRQE